MDRNHALMDIVSAKGYLGEELYRGICKEYPQFNPSSQVERTDQYQIQLAIMEQFEWPGQQRQYPKPGILPRLWRALGELLNSKRVRDRGMMWDAERTIPPMKTRTLQLKRYGVTQGAESISIAVAYDAMTDTLYIRDWNTPASRTSRGDRRG